MRTALVVIDVQSYFTKDAPADLPAKIANYIKASDFDSVAFTIFQNKDGSAWERNLYWTKSKWPEDIKLPAEFIEFTSKNNVFLKHSYSAFKAKGLEEYLKKSEIEKLELCGIDLEGCVLATAYDAFDKGYEVKVLFDLSHGHAELAEGAKKIIKKNIQTKNDPGSN